MILIMFLFGLYVGSIAITATYRWIEGKNHSDSVCLTCHKGHSWKTWIPVVSYILYRGRCGYCHDRIPFVYPLAEVLTGLIFATVSYYYGASVEAFRLIFASWLIMLMVITDIKARIIPNELIILGLSGVLSYWFLSDTSILSVIIGFIFPSVTILLISVVIEMMTAKKGIIGGGDIKFLFFIGGLMGAETATAIFIYGMVIMVLVYFSYIIEGMKVGKETPIPMMVGFGMAWLYMMLMFFLPFNVPIFI